MNKLWSWINLSYEDRLRLSALLTMTPLERVVLISKLEDQQRYLAQRRVEELCHRFNLI